MTSKAEQLLLKRGRLYFPRYGKYQYLRVCAWPCTIVEADALMRQFGGSYISGRERWVANARGDIGCVGEVLCEQESRILQKFGIILMVYAKLEQGEITGFVQLIVEHVDFRGRMVVRFEDYIQPPPQHW